MPVKPVQFELQNKAYEDWAADPNPKTTFGLLKAYDRLISGEVMKHRGGIASPALKGHAKKIALEAFRSYDPARKTALSTHLVNQLKRLHRLNYESAQALRMSEELQAGAHIYRGVKDELTQNLGREPTMQELQKQLGWTKSKVGRMERQLRGEVSSSRLDFEPGVFEVDESDPKIDYVYHDLSPRDQKIFELVTGYAGSPRLTKVEIAKQLNVSPVIISQRSAAIAKKLQEVAGFAGE